MLRERSAPRYSVNGTFVLSADVEGAGRERDSADIGGCLKRVKRDTSDGRQRNTRIPLPV